jgi:hypothetical protein
LLHVLHVHAKQFTESGWERNNTILVALATVDPYLTALQIDIGEAYIDQLTDAHTSVE